MLPEGSLQGHPRPWLTYKPLNHAAREIRVIDIAPGIGSSTIEGKFRTISLQDKSNVSAYETISYCWGPVSPPLVAIVDGEDVSIPASSEAALRCMRLPDRARTLWIDAVCMNQASKTEKAQQVAFMGTIYSLGTQNLVYLGDDAQDMAGRAVKAVQDVLQHGAVFKENAEEDGCDGVLVDEEALRNLFSQPWFRRLWVIQEMALASSTTVHWGTYQMKLLDVTNAASDLTGWSKRMPDQVFRTEGLYCAMQMNQFIDPDGSYYARHPDLCQMFFLVMTFEKSEPRDSVFAVLGLIRPWHSSCQLQEQERCKLLEVDYTKPLQDVLRDATRYALCERQDLGALRMLFHGADISADSSEGFATWTVRADLTYPWHDYWQLPYYKACKGLDRPTLLHDQSQGSNILILEGFTVDSISHISDPCNVPTASAGPDLLAWLRDVMAIAPNTCRSPIDRAFALVAGIWGRMRPDPEGYQEAMDLSNTLARAQTQEALAGFVDDASLVAAAEATVEDMATQKLFMYCQGRRFFVTNTGRAGLGPRCMRPGDIVGIFKGGDMPLVLRHAESHYQLMGEAYVHDCSKGEAVDAHQKEGGKITNFLIC